MTSLLLTHLVKMYCDIIVPSRLFSGTACQVGWGYRYLLRWMESHTHILQLGCRPGSVVSGTDLNMEKVIVM